MDRSCWVECHGVIDDSGMRLEVGEVGFDGTGSGGM